MPSFRSSVFATVAVAAVVLSACTNGANIMDASARADGKTLGLIVASCNADLTAEVVESPSRVIVTVTARNDTTDDCADRLIVTLSTCRWANVNCWTAFRETWCPSDT